LKPDLSELKYVTTITTPFANYVRYQQVIGDHPVFTNQVVVTVSRIGKVQLVVSDFKEAQEVEIPSGQMTQEERTDKAFAQIGSKDKKTWGPTKQEFGYIIQNGKAIPVYRVVVHTVNPFGAWETYLQAGDGKLLKKKDLNRHTIGAGKVFLPNPVETQRSASGLSDQRDADSPA
jgi:Zn-dependent metalloprotease